MDCHPNNDCDEYALCVAHGHDETDNDNRCIYNDTTSEIETHYLILWFALIDMAFVFGKAKVCSFKIRNVGFSSCLMS